MMYLLILWFLLGNANLFINVECVIVKFKNEKKKKMEKRYWTEIVQ